MRLLLVSPFLLLTLLLLGALLLLSALYSLVVLLLVWLVERPLNAVFRATCAEVNRLLRWVKGA